MSLAGLVRAVFRVRRDQDRPTRWRRARDWMRGAWLTVRYVDEWTRFPAILPIQGGRVRITKKPGARMTVKGQIFLQGFLYSPVPSVIAIDAGGTLEVQGNMLMGDNNRFKVARGALLQMGGSVGTSRFIMNSSSVIAAESELRMGPGCIVGHFCLVTDGEWHPIGKGARTLPTILEKETWLYDGAKVIKGVRLGAGSVVTTNAVVLPGEYAPGSLLAGVPAVVKRTGLVKRNE